MQKARGKRVHGNFLTDIIFENENIYLLFDDGDKLLIKNGKYSKERKKIIYREQGYLQQRVEYGACCRSISDKY